MKSCRTSAPALDGIHPNDGYTMFAEMLTKVKRDTIDGLTEKFIAYTNTRYND